MAETLLKALQEIDKLHQPDPDAPPWCDADGHRWPCQTHRIISSVLDNVQFAVSVPRSVLGPTPPDIESAILSTKESDVREQKT